MANAAALVHPVAPLLRVGLDQGLDAGTVRHDFGRTREGVGNAVRHGNVVGNVTRLHTPAAKM